VLSVLRIDFVVVRKPSLDDGAKSAKLNMNGQKGTLEIELASIVL